MDPISIVMLVALVLGTGTGGLALRRHSVQKQMAEAVRSPISCGNDLVLSVFDVFWDVGADEFALELMAHRGLLLDAPADLQHILRALPESIAEHGGYPGLIAALQTAAQGFRKSAQSRGRYALAAPTQKLLPLPPSAQAVDSVQQTTSLVPRSVSRGTEFHGAVIGPKEIAGEVDIDTVLKTDPMGILNSLFTGSQGVKRWLGLRDARRLHANLNRHFEALYDIYVQLLRQPDNGLSHLYHADKEWRAEVTRIQVQCQQRTWGGESWAGCADALMEQAKELSNSLAKGVRGDIDESLQHIDSLANNGDKAMAGYIVYLNRYAFFAGRLARCESCLRNIENATHRLQQELRDCRAQGLM